MGLDVHQQQGTYCILNSSGTVVQGREVIPTRHRMSQFAAAKLRRTDRVALKTTTNCRAVVATARKLAMIAWWILTTGEKRRGGNRKGLRREAELAVGSRTIKSLDDVCWNEGLPPCSPLAAGDMSRQTLALLIRCVVCFGWITLSSQCGLTSEKSPEPVMVETRTASPLGTTGVSVNGRIQPRGLPARYWFEYGASTRYGQTTPPRDLPPRLAAYYLESWDQTSAGWLGGMSGEDLQHHSEGGNPGGFVRFSEPSGDDLNHADGIGILHLTSWFYPGTHPSETGFMGSLSAGDPDFRDALVSISVRGDHFVPNGAELVWWTQSDNDISQQLTADWRRANWAFTAFSLNDALASGKWEKVVYQLTNDTSHWTYGGNNLEQGRPHYAYNSISSSLEHLNCNFFHLLAFVDPDQPPTGSVDLDEFLLTYRNRSLVFPGNGGSLVASPDGASEDTGRITDGWRHGIDRMWQSGRNPALPQEFTWEFISPVTIDAVQIHQHTEWPSRDIQVLTSADGVAWQPLIEEVMPQSSPGGPNFAFVLKHNLGRAARFAKLRVASGYRTEHWGLGEVEMFGSGAVMATEDSWNYVNADLTGLQPGEVCHYRLVAENSIGRFEGMDLICRVPADAIPHVVIGPAHRTTADSATVTGRLTPMGLRTSFRFEYGIDTRYGATTPLQYAGVQMTPRHTAARLEGLKPNTTYHYRLIGLNEKGSGISEDATFMTSGSD